MKFQFWAFENERTEESILKIVYITGYLKSLSPLLNPIPGPGEPYSCMG